MVVFIHRHGILENEEYQEEYGKQRLFELIHSGWIITKAVKDPEDNVLYVNMKKGDLIE